MADPSRQPGRQAAGGVNLPELDPTAILKQPQLVDVEQNILDAAISPEDPGVVRVVPDDDTLGPLAYIVQLLQPRLVLLLLPGAPPTASILTLSLVRERERSGTSCEIIEAKQWKIITWCEALSSCSLSAS